MHIVHVITRLIIGGAQENTVLTCRGLVNKGHRVTLVAGSETGPEGSLWSDAESAGCGLVRLDSLRRAVSPWRDLAAHRDLRRLFQRLRPDLVHTHSSKAGILGRSAARSAGVPLIVHTIHGMSFNRTQGALARAVYRLLERRAATYTDRLVTVADAMVQQGVTAGLAPRDRFTTIHSGMETDDFRPDRATREAVRAGWGLTEHEVVVGTIARLFENKGYEAILEAMPSVVARVPNLRFVWIGDGALRDRYERRLTAMGLRERVRFVGLVTPREVARLLNGFDLLVHASRWEGLPRSVVQAMLSEVPVISYDNDGAPEVVTPDETGVLVPYGDTAKLADAVVALSAAPARRTALGRAGRLRCAEPFDWRRMVDELDRLYHALASDRKSCGL